MMGPVGGGVGDRVWIGRVLWLILLLGLLAGCTATTKDASVSFMQLAPGEDVQMATTTVVGIEAQPLGVDGPTLRLGYVRNQRSRVPAFEAPGTRLPNVRMSTKVEGGGTVIEELDVADERGLFK